MATVQRTILKLSTSISQSGIADHGGALAAAFPDIDINWPNGTTGNQADAWWCDVDRALAGSANEDLDLTALPAAGSPDGAAVTLADVRIWAVHCPSTNGGTIEIKPGAANGWLAKLKDATDTFLVEPGETLLLAMTGTDNALPIGGSTKVINVNNTDGSGATYTMLFVGAAT